VEKKKKDTLRECLFNSEEKISRRHHHLSEDERIENQGRSCSLLNDGSGTPRESRRGLKGTLS